MSGSRIDEVVDAIAAAPALLSIDGNAIAAVWGAGSGLIDDPLRPGGQVQKGIPGVNAIVPFSWWVIPPRTTGLAFGGATSTEISWLAEGRLYVPRADPSGVLDGYQALITKGVNALLKLFTATSTGSPTLSDTCAAQEPRGVSFGSDADWLWLAVSLAVTEVVNLND